MLVYFLYGLFFISCIVLVATVLLQPGKADAGELFTSNISSTAFGPRGTQSVLSRITIGAAICFMLAALLLSMPAITGDVSVLNSAGTTRTETTTPATTETDPNANNAVVTPGETNTNTTAAPESATNTNSAANK
jgi:preprotein translocase subunit SecG